MCLKARAYLFPSICLTAFVWAQTDVIYLTGTVTLAGGAPPPTTVRVELKCHGSIVQSVFTSTEGRFSFRMSESNPGVKSKPDGRRMDASIGGPAIPADVDKRTQLGRTAFHQVDLSRCQCEATLSGYRADPVSLGVRSRFDDPDLGVIVLHPLGAKDTTVSITSLKAPGKAMEAYQKAQGELSKKKVKYSNVIRHLEKATELYPEFAEAWYLLGEAYLAEQDVNKARLALRHALTTDPLFVKPYVSLAQLELQTGGPETAAVLTAQALELNPEWIPASYWYAVAQFYLGDLEQSEKSILRVQQSSEAQSYPASHHLLGNIYTEKGRYEAAAQEFRTFLRTNPTANFVSEVQSILNAWENSGLIEPTNAPK
ncbi:MAG: tetratricopeptide repeat protein [bacterium]